jgi:methyl-accepting chemotaxis protein
MAKSTKHTGFFHSPWLTLARIAFTAIFFFWLYWISVSTKDLDDRINAATDKYTAVDSLQVEYKDEIQEWKDLLLRSNNRDTLNKNWLNYEARYRKVAASAQNIIIQNDVRSINQKMTSFVDAHKANHDKYKNSVLILIKNKYFPGPADAAVKGIDRPLLDILKATNEDMREEKNRTNDSLVAQARNRIEQSLFALGFIGLLAIWMPKH